MEFQETLQVLVRLRPSHEENHKASVVTVKDDCVILIQTNDGKKELKCTYDSVIDQHTSQSEVYDLIRGCTDAVLNGIHSTIFAYGQTG